MYTLDKFGRGILMKIAEVSKKFDISADTLRYYEKVGLLPPVNRSENGIRDFDETDLRRVDFIKSMRRAGLSIEILTEYIHLVREGDETIEKRKKIIADERDKLLLKKAELDKTLNLLDYKIDVYEKALLTKEKGLVDKDIR
jgi:DNA-binding transcriptional MerR regulator